jgi:hypothetical protein
MAAKKEERWVIDFEKSEVVKLRANKEQGITQSSLIFASKEAGLEEFKRLLKKKVLQLQKDLEFVKEELTHTQQTLLNLDSPDTVEITEIT